MIDVEEVAGRHRRAGARCGTTAAAGSRAARSCRRRRRRGRGTASSRCRSARCPRSEQRRASTGSGTASRPARRRRLPVKSAASSSSWPRATVPGDQRPRRAAVGEERARARAARTSAGRACPAGSRRARAATSTPTSSRARVSRGRVALASVLHLATPRAAARRSRKRRVSSRSNCGSVASMQRKKRSRDASAKRGTLKTGWYGIGRPFSASMPSTADERGDQDRHLEGDRDERRPAVERPAADVERVVDHRRPVLRARSRRARRGCRRSARAAAAPVVDVRAPRPAPRSGTACRRRCRGSPPRASGARRRPARSDVVELGHAGRRSAGVGVMPRSSFTSASGSSVRISKIEIIGRKRMKRNSRRQEQPDACR